MTNVNSPCTGEAGHPLQILMLENEQLKKRLDALEEMIRQQSDAGSAHHPHSRGHPMALRSRFSSASQ